MIEHEAPTESTFFLRTWIVIVRCVLTLNFLLFALSFSVWFEGNSKQVGMADRLFENYRFDGWRADFVWLILSTGFILLALMAFGISDKDFRSLRNTKWLCVAWIVACVIYVVKSVLTGQLWFG
jgi:hypothetical protein